MTTYGSASFHPAGFDNRQAVRDAIAKRPRRAVSGEHSERMRIATRSLAGMCVGTPLSIVVRIRKNQSVTPPMQRPRSASLNATTELSAAIDGVSR